MNKKVNELVQEINQEENTKQRRSRFPKLTKRAWKNIGKIALILLLVLITALIVYLVFYFLGWTGAEWEARIQNDIQAAGGWAPLIFIAVQVFYTVVLFIIPGQTIAFIALGLILFPAWQTFIYVTIGMMISSTINFSIGKLLGEKVVRKIIGSEVVDEYMPKLKKKANIYYPFFMVMPAFPDDEICMIVGMTGMTYKYFIPVTFLTRTIGIAVAVFIGEIIPWASLAPRSFIALGTDFIIVMFIVFAFARRLELYVDRKEQGRDEAEEKSENY